MLAAILQASGDSADICFLLSALMLFVMAAMDLVRKDISGLGWVALGLIPMGMMFLTP